MKTLHLHSPTRLRQAGMTLIELMISITIGLFIIGAALMVFQNVTGIGSQITELTQLRQQGAHAFRAIGKQISEAGAVEPTYVADNSNFFFDPPSTQYFTNGGISSWTPPPGGTDPLGIAQLELASKSADYSDLLRNCVGAKVTTASRTSNFYVKPISGESYGDLMCSPGGTALDQPIIRNVNAFKVRYRVRPSAANMTTKRFVDTPTNWSLVDAVEVCLDLVGDRSTPTKSVDAGGTSVDTTYTDCAGNTVSLGNRLHVVQRNLFTVYSAQR